MPSRGGPPRPLPTRVALFIDGQNLYHRCRDHFQWGWIHPRRLGEALVDEDRARYGRGSHVLTCVRNYTGIHDLARQPAMHRTMTRRLQAYAGAGITTIPIPLRYDSKGNGREKGVDVRLSIDMVRLARKGLFDIAIIASEDSDLDETVKDLYDLRDSERWIAVENALPLSQAPNARNPRWLSSARRRRPITPAMFNATKDGRVY